MQAAVGRWDALPEDWEGINGLYARSGGEIAAEAQRQDDATGGLDQWLGVYSIGTFEEQMNGCTDLRDAFNPLKYWVKFITEDGEKVI